MDPLPPTLSVPQGAKALGVNPRTLYNLVGRRECPAIRAGRVIRIPTIEFITALRLDRDLVERKLAEPQPHLVA
jgi:excisionase family DNA binding protein